MHIRRLIIAIIINISTLAHAQDMGQQIDALIAEELPGANVAVVVQRLDTRERIVSRNAEQLFMPASVVKLLTAYVAFKALDFDHTFDTELYTDDDNVYIRFTGDPSLKTKDLYALLDNLKTKRIKGDIIIDDTVFAKPYYARGWTYDSIDWYYSAPVSSVMLDKNTFKATLQAGQELNEPTIIQLAKDDYGIELQSDVSTTTEYDADNLCQINVNVDARNNINIFGCWPISVQARSLGIAVHDPNLYVQQRIEQYLQANNIRLRGEIKIGTTPTGLKPLATHRSKRLMDLAKKILQDSDNFYAEAYTKTLGAHFYNDASFQAGSYAIKQQLQELLEIDEEQIKLSDGSGSSVYNLLTANAIAKVLHAAYHDKSIQPAFNYALARPGEKGSLKTRMENLPKDAQFAGKTGSLTNVSTLAGTMVHPDRVPLLVVIMQNGSKLKSSDRKIVEDKIIEIIYKAPVAQLDSASPS